MAQIGEYHLLVKSYLAEGGAIAANLIVVAGTANNQCKLPGAAEEDYNLGITVSAAAAAGDPIEVCMIGIAKLKVNAASPAIVVGDAISSHGTTGRGRQWTKANAKHCVGRALDASAADADIIPVLVNLFSPPAT